jgi:uncharacterized iron-regulated membrane protein
MLRNKLVLVHRWVGLALAVFLVPAALTGSVLVWKNPIDQWLNPGLFTVPVRDGVPLSEAQLVAAVLQQQPAARVSWVAMPGRPGQSAQLGVRDWPSAGSARRINEAFADPYTGLVLGLRSTTDPRLNRAELMAWLRRFHYTLMMKGTGMTLMGTVALAWMIDCVVGGLLTLPRSVANWRQWRRSWQLRPARFNFDLHRASGLWVWPILFLLAASGVYLNLTHEVFVPAVEWLARGLVPEQLRARTVETILEWQHPLHTGTAFGLTGRIVVCLAGLVVTVLAITGASITSRKLLRKHEPGATIYTAGRPHSN